MILTLADSNVILDVTTNDPAWGDWSAGAIEERLALGKLAINPIIFAELSVGFDRIEDLDAILPADDFERLDLPWEGAFLAARAYALYRQRAGSRRSPLADFYIGAHAAVSGLPLLTRDATRYRTYFPGLELIAP